LFSVYKAQQTSMTIGSFDIAQTNANEIILAIREFISLKGNVYVDKTNSSKLKVTNITCISNISNFLENAPVKLLGYKKSQYLL
jgi:hypothetical protein